MTVTNFALGHNGIDPKEVYGEDFPGIFGTRER